MNNIEFYTLQRKGYLFSSIHRTFTKVENILVTKVNLYKFNKLYWLSSLTIMSIT